MNDNSTLARVPAPAFASAGASTATNTPSLPLLEALLAWPRPLFLGAFENEWAHVSSIA